MGKKYSNYLNEINKLEFIFLFSKKKTIGIVIIIKKWSGNPTINLEIFINIKKKVYQ